MTIRSSIDFSLQSAPSPSWPRWRHTSTSAWGAFQVQGCVPVTNANITEGPIPLSSKKPNSISRAASWLCREKNLWRYTHLTTRRRRPGLHATGRRHHRTGFLTGLSHLSRHHPHRSNLIRRTIRLAHFGSLLPPDNRTQGGTPFAANRPAPLRGFDQFLTPASYLQMGNWPFWIPNGLVTSPTPENESSIRNSRQSMSSGGILGLLAQASAGLPRSTRSDSRSAKQSASGGILARSQHPRWHDDADRPRSVTARQTADWRGRRSLFQDCYLQ
jgi:hypothetical protein